MNRIETIVDRTIIINIKERTDRKAQVIDQMNNIGYENYEFFEAFTPKSDNVPQEYIDRTLISDFKMSGWFGNKFSHYGVIDYAKRNGLKSVMIFEDDVCFRSNFIDVCDLALDQLEDIKWDWLQLGGNHSYFGYEDCDRVYGHHGDGLTQISSNLAKINRMLTAHAYIVKDTVYDFILDNCLQSFRSIDNFYAYEVHRRFGCYCVRPGVATQFPGVNDIGMIYTDYTQYID